MPFSMGDPVLHAGKTGTVLGLHAGDLADVLYADGSGAMMIPFIELTTSNHNNAPGGSDAEESSNAGNAHPKIKKTAIGWNPGAIDDATPLAAAAEALPNVVGVGKHHSGGGGFSKGSGDSKRGSTSAATPSAGGAWAPTVGESVECRDHATKEWKAALVVHLDAELGTVDVRTLNNGLCTLNRG